MDLHVKLEKELADYRGTESSITFQSGYATNLGTIMCLVDERDLIISDELNHGSIIDGCRLTKAERRVYKHKDMGDLEKQLQGTERFRRVLVITDGVFSMDGDIAPLKDIVNLAQEHNAMTYVDDAHGDGVLGENGRGIPTISILKGRWILTWEPSRKPSDASEDMLSDRRTSACISRTRSEATSSPGHTHPPSQAHASRRFKLSKNNRPWSRSSGTTPATSRKA